MPLPPNVSPARFLDVALSRKGPCFISYLHHQHQLPHLKLLIRKDLLSLLDDFSSLSLSTVPTPSSSSITTTASSGRALHLLAASGPLHLPSLQLLHLTVILHPSHPYARPHVQVCTIPPLLLLHHPFVDPLHGHVTTPYLLSWKHPKSNLPDLVRNLVNIFSFWPIHTLEPLPPHPRRLGATSISRREAVDRLAMHLLHDVASFHAEADLQIHALRLQLNPTLSHRSTQLDLALQSLHHELSTLTSVLDQTTEATAALEDWLATCTSNLKPFFQHLSTETAEEGKDEEAAAVVLESLEAFQGIDEKSEKMLEHVAEDYSIEDVMTKLEKELDRGTINLEEYLKLIRSLAKEQFYHVLYQLGSPFSF